MKIQRASSPSLILASLAVTVFIPLFGVFAQEGTTAARVEGIAQASGSEVRINQIDTSSFPKVTIFATVLKNGTPVEGLTEKDFRVREDEVDQEPLTVVPQLSALNAAITIDTSGSIKKALPQVQTAAINFLDSLGATDRFSVLSFAREVKTLSSNGDKASAKLAISQTVARGDTALFDAIYESIVSVKDKSGRKAVILLSDGVDDDGRGGQLSKHSIAEALELAKTVNVPLFVIGLGPEKDVATLERIAAASGGRYFDALTADQLEGIYKQIGKEITGQYNIYYSSNLPADGSLHRVNLSYSGIQGVKEYQSPATGTVPAAAITAPKSEVGSGEVANKDFAKPTTVQIISDKPGLHVAVTMNEGGEATQFKAIRVLTKPSSAFEKEKQVETCYNEKSCSFALAPGRYKVTAEKGDAETTVETELKAGEANNLWINLNAGMIAVAAIPAEGAAPTTMTKVTAEKQAASAFDKAKELSHCYGTELCEMIVPAGKYRVIVTKDQAVATQEVILAPAQKAEVQMNLKAGILNVVGFLTAGGEQVKFKKVTVVKPAESNFGKEEQVDTCYSEERCNFVLNGGRYLVQGEVEEATVSELIDIPVGGQVDKSLVFNAGKVKIALMGANGAPVRSERIRVLLPAKTAVDEPTVVSTCYSTDVCKLILPAGKYFAEAKNDKVVNNGEFSVTAGQDYNIELKAAN